MQQVNDMLDFDIDTPSDKQLKKIYEGEAEMFQRSLPAEDVLTRAEDRLNESAFSGGNKVKPNADQRKKSRNAQKRARRKARA